MTWADRIILGLGCALVVGTVLVLAVGVAVTWGAVNATCRTCGRNRKLGPCRHLH